MKTKMMMGLVVAAMAAAAFADVPQALTYRGVLRRSGGGEQSAGAIELTFRLYDSKTPETVLWARTVRVPIDTNGVFYAELNDTDGLDPDGIGRTLADAIGMVKGAPEIGLAPRKRKSSSRVNGFPRLRARRARSAPRRRTSCMRLRVRWQKGFSSTLRPSRT